MAFIPRLTAPAYDNRYFISIAGGGYNKCIERRGHWVLPNCFSGDTKIITRSGLVRLDSIVDQEVEVLSLGGVYRKATGRYFGKQELYEITLRSGDTFRCTSNHRWYVKRSNGEFVFKTTDELRSCDYIPYSKTSGIGIDRAGVINGFIYGDGSLYNNRNYARAMMCGEKREYMMPYFEDAPHICHDSNGTIECYPYDKEMKYIPSITSDLFYLKGFITGLIASDGNVDKDGCVNISTAKEHDADRIREILSVLGVRCRIKKKVRDTNFKSNSTLYIIAIKKSFMSSDMFLNPKHLERFSAMSRDDSFTRVKSIKPLHIVEDVYCVQEPETQTMTLEGNILTGNCPGYAYGRFMEIGGVRKCNLSTHNAGLWWGNTADGYSRGKSPKLGAVICWAKGSEPGHVAIVEKINKDGTIVTSESGYSAKKDFWTQTRRNNGNWGQSSAYQFQGFIYNPWVDGSEDPQTVFVDTAIAMTGHRVSTSMELILKSAEKAKILGTVIPRASTPSDIGLTFTSSMGSINLGSANGCSNIPSVGDIILIRTNQNRKYTDTTSCDYAGIVHSVKGSRIGVVRVNAANTVIQHEYDASSNLIAGYYHPRWTTVDTTESEYELMFAVAQQLYTQQNTNEDAIMREVAYWRDGQRSLNPSGIRLSVSNYTTLLSSVVNSGTAAPTNLSALLASSQTFLTDNMKNQNARIILQFLVSKGLMESQAIGFLANIQMESGFLPSAVNKSSGAAGICQWFQTRKTAMVNFVGSNWRNNLTGQCEYLWHELNTSEKSTLIKLRDKITTNTIQAAQDATILVLYSFERPGRNEEAEERRKGYARDLWNQLTHQLKTV